MIAIWLLKGLGVMKNSLKSKIASFILIIILASLPFCSEAFAYEKEQNVVIGVPTNRCPMFYIDEDTNELAGIGIDLLHKIDQNCDLSFTIIPIEEYRPKQALDNPRYDITMPFGSKIFFNPSQITVAAISDAPALPNRSRNSS